MWSLRVLTDSWAGDFAVGVIAILSSSVIVLQGWRFCRRRMRAKEDVALYLIILDGRMSLYVPFLSAIQYAVSWVPALLFYTEVPISIIEGYLLCCFLALMATDCGGLSAIQVASSHRQPNVNPHHQRCFPVISQFQLAQRAVCVALLFRPLWIGLGIILQHKVSSQLSSSLQIMFQVVSAIILFHGIGRCCSLCKYPLSIKCYCCCEFFNEHL